MTELEITLLMINGCFCLCILILLKRQGAMKKNGQRWIASLSSRSAVLRDENEEIRVKNEGLRAKLVQIRTAKVFISVSDAEWLAGKMQDGSPLPTPESIDPAGAISQETVDNLLKGTGKAIQGGKDRTDDYHNPGDIAEIGARGIKRWVRQPDEVRHKGGADCPSCGGIGFFWLGWFSCDSCQAIALGETGETYLPGDKDNE